MSEPVAFELSVVLITPDCLETIRKPMKHLRAQSVRDHLEIVIVLPAEAHLDSDDPDLEGFAGIQIVQMRDMRSTSAARVAGVRHASAPIIAFVEDHSFPEADWAAALIDAHRQAWAAVGPIIENANPASAVSWANLFIEYGEWLGASCPEHAAFHLPGHNSSYKRAILLDYGEKLEAMMQAESVLHWDLRARGYGIAVERRARTKHLNFSGLASSTRMRFWSARLFGAARSHDWPIGRRVVYIVGSPLIPLVRAWRILRQMRRHQWQGGFGIRIWLTILFLLVCDAGGEMLGYVLGPGDAEEKVASFEFHRQRFLNRDDAIQWDQGGLFIPQVKAD